MTRWITFVLAAFITLPLMAQTEPTENEGAQPIGNYVATIRAGATDLAEASAFYRKHFGFTTMIDASEHGFIVLDNHGVMLVLTPSEQPVEIKDDQCFVAINFRTDDLASTVASLEKSGIEITAENESAVGKYVTIHDPSGNRIHVKELSYEHPDGPAGDSPRVYNLGIRVTDMDEALAFYEGILGYSVFSRDYYPPVIPMNKRGNVAFILSDDATEPAPYDNRRVAFAGIAFEVRDIMREMKALKERGVQFLSDKPTQAGNVIHAPFVDPFGNVHEIIQHVAPGTPPIESEPAEPEQATPATQLEDLAWISGTWRSGSGDNVLEETWSAADGDAMLGMFRWTRDGHTWLYEIMAIEQDDDGIAFRLRHFSRNLTPWKSEADGPLTYPLVSATENKVVFENPERDQPRRFVYERSGDTLSVHIVGADGSEDVFRFGLKD